MEHVPLNPALRSIKQEDYGFEGSQFCAERPVSKEKKNWNHFIYFENIQLNGAVTHVMEEGHWLL